MKKLWLFIICLMLFLCTVGVYWSIQQPVKKLAFSKTEMSAKKHIIQKEENESGSYILPYILSAILPSKMRGITFPTFNISFQTPGWIVTSKELGLNNPYSSLGGSGETFYSMDTTGDSTNTFQKSGVVTDFEPSFIAASSTVNDPSYVLFDNTNKNILHDPTAQVKVLDNTKLLVKSSIVSPDEIKIYSYLAADDHGNGRGKLGYKYQGDILLHVELPNYSQSAIDIRFFCYDLDAKAALSNRCHEVLATLLSSLQVKNAILLPSTPLYSQKDIFSFLPFVKRQSPIDISTVSSSDNKATLGEPFKSIRQQKALTSLQDEDLSVMRCLPQIIYFNDQGTAFAIPGGNAAYNNPFHITDANLLHIIALVQAKNPDHMYPTQLLACQTDTGNYIVEYTTATNNITSDDDIHPSQDVANFAEIFPNGSLQTITTIPTIHTVTKNTTCTTP
ncbi:MAG TPA: hypothetical protein VLF89_00755, partial [Candidatus Saccharimonadales bacterium]|nr:hypothetical protein [Candidatus Saccharimonadales bacterium]